MSRLSKIGAACLAAFGWTSGVSAVTATYLVVAGGGSGGGARDSGSGTSAGGGAGGLLTGTASLNPTLSYTVTVGAGGAAISGANASGNNGSDSSLGEITSTGGGGGGAALVSPPSGKNGGSGGGGSESSSGGTGTSGQGFAGGSGGSGSTSSGGGGGSSAVGADGTSGASGAGGAGTASSISGSSVTYAGGGGGGASSNKTRGVGGSGGGGDGGTNGAAGSNGTANLGGGGGASGANGGNPSGAGGSGIVIISYAGVQQFSGGVVTSVGGNTIHTFTTSGTLGPITPITASFLVVAGGGGGGYNYHTVSTGGGGGAGGYRTSSGLIIDPNSTYLVTVGAGGVGSPNTSTNGSPGTDSAFSSITSAGGGYGATNQQVGGNGGSGGGASGPFTPGSYAGGVGNTPSTSPVQGYDGGSATQYGGGGGGGSSAVGQTASAGGAGGAGTANSISGSSVTYATGGGGNGSAGAANTGNGGDRGLGGALNPGYAGGSGVVIISYPGSTQLLAGGTVTIVGGNVIHTFTSTGYLAPIKYATNSLRFRSSASAYLNRTPTTPTNQAIWTWSAWVKRGSNFGSAGFLFAAGTVSSNDAAIYFETDNTLIISKRSGYTLATSQVFRDPAAWYHIQVAYDSTQATSSNRIKLYINGSQVTAFGTATYPTLNETSSINSTAAAYMGRRSDGYYFDGYLTEINFIDGQALTPNSFGTFNSYGVWQPINYGGSYGTNGFYLPFINSATGPTVSADFLVVAGGGSGSNSGGGAGGFRTSAGTSGGGGSAESQLTLYTAQSYVVTVGAGGAAATGAPITGNSGSNSTFSTITSTGGGAGGYASSNGNSGGSGGGGGYTSGTLTTGGSGTANQGYAGGNASSPPSGDYVSGGGGGAGAVGGNNSGNTSGSGGSGVASSITGSSVTYAGGGGGGARTPQGTSPGSGGSGGGGNGSGTGNGSNATANTGGGGGGGAVSGGGNPSTTTSGQGGSGIVVISYTGPQRYTGGTVTTSGGKTIHTFTSSGVLTSIFNDFSPNGNNWTGNNFDVTNTTASTYDSMTDVPTLTSATAANYCTLNPLAKGSTATVADGNLKTTSNGRASGSTFATIAMSSDVSPIYWETAPSMTVTNSDPFMAGIVPVDSSVNVDSRATGFMTYCYTNNVAVVYQSTTVSLFSISLTLQPTDIMQFAYKPATNEIWLGINNTWYDSAGGTTGNPSTGANPTKVVDSAKTWVANLCVDGPSSLYAIANFGQRPFAYTPPSGFVALNTYNM